MFIENYVIMYQQRVWPNKQAGRTFVYIYPTRLYIAYHYIARELKIEKAATRGECLEKL